MAIPVQDFIDRLTSHHRVIVIGGLAVIGHGYSRHTQDADVWLEPMSSAQQWAGVVEEACNGIPGATIHRLPGWVEINGQDIADAIEETGMVRILGLNCPLDIFRRPNEFDESSFELVASRAKLNGDGTLLPDALDLIQSKIDTGRDKDQKDIDHLESVIRDEYFRRLPTANLEEATELLARYSEWRVLEAALKNPYPEVKELALSQLRDFADSGDPFSAAILAGREIP
jgi:hypothetical protein